MQVACTFLIFLLLFVVGTTDRNEDIESNGKTRAQKRKLRQVQMLLSFANNPQQGSQESNDTEKGLKIDNRKRENKTINETPVKQGNTDITLSSLLMLFLTVKLNNHLALSLSSFMGKVSAFCAYALQCSPFSFSSAGKGQFLTSIF